MGSPSQLPPLGSERRFASSSSSRAAACCCGAAGLRAGGASWCSAQCTVRQTNLYGCLSAGPIKRQSSSHWPAAVQINLSTKRGHPRPSFLREILRGRGRGGWLELVVVGVFWLGQHQHQPGTWGTKHMPPVAGQSGQPGPESGRDNRQIPAAGAPSCWRLEPGRGSPRRWTPSFGLQLLHFVSVPLSSCPRSQIPDPVRAQGCRSRGGETKVDGWQGHGVRQEQDVLITWQEETRGWERETDSWTKHNWRREGSCLVGLDLGLGGLNRRKLPHAPGQDRTVHPYQRQVCRPAVSNRSEVTLARGYLPLCLARAGLAAGALHCPAPPDEVQPDTHSPARVVPPLNSRR